MDSPARMSLSAKREMFESGAHLTPVAEKPDSGSSMVSLSRRKALFEEVKSVDPPIARFGESVSPAKDMIMSGAKHGAVRNTSNSETKPSVTPKVPMPRDDDGTPRVGGKTGELHLRAEYLLQQQQMMMNPRYPDQHHDNMDPRIGCHPGHPGNDNMYTSNSVIYPNISQLPCLSDQEPGANESH